jgi:hypothetical protein
MEKLTPTKMIGTASVTEEKTTDYDYYLKEHLPLIKCECGAEILLVPDLKAMNHAIEAHVGEHRNKGNNPARAITYSRIRQLLVQLTLIKASEPARH